MERALLVGVLLGALLAGLVLTDPTPACEQTIAIGIRG